MEKKEKTHRCVGHLVCAKGSNISQQIANMQQHRHSGCWKGELSSSPHQAQRTHWCNEARASLAFKCYASMGPDQKTNGDRSPIRPERAEVKRVWLQLHKYLAQCQFDVRICRVSWAAQGCTGPRELHCSPWTPAEGKLQPFLRSYYNVSAKAKIGQLAVETVTAIVTRTAITRVKQLQNHKQNCEAAMETQNTLTGGWFPQLCGRVNNSAAKETTKRQNKT